MIFRFFFKFGKFSIFDKFLKKTIFLLNYAVLLKFLILQNFFQIYEIFIFLSKLKKKLFCLKLRPIFKIQKFVKN